MSGEAERWREVKAAVYRPGLDDGPLMQAGDALAAALEATVAKDEAAMRALTGAHAALRQREQQLDDLRADRDQLFAALEARDREHDARDRRIAELEAGLRRISELMENFPCTERTIARDLLAGRAAGGGE